MRYYIEHRFQTNFTRTFYNCDLSKEIHTVNYNIVEIGHCFFFLSVPLFITISPAVVGFYFLCCVNVYDVQSVRSLVLFFFFFLFFLCNFFWNMTLTLFMNEFKKSASTIKNNKNNTKFMSLFNKYIKNEKLSLNCQTPLNNISFIHQC